MSTDITAHQQDPRRCENCGAPLVGRFSPCVACHSIALEGFGADAVRLPARRFWHPSPGALVYRYDSIDEAELVAKARRRSRGRILVAVSVLAVSSAVYLACIHGDEVRVGAPVATKGIVSAQNGKPSVAAAGNSSAGAAQLLPGGVAQRQQQHQRQQQQQQPVDVAPRLASVPPSPAMAATPAAAATPERHQPVSTTPDAARVTAAEPPSAKDRQRVDTRPGGTAQQQPGELAQHLAPVQSSPATPPAAPAPEQHRVASTTPDAARAPAVPPVSVEDKLRKAAPPSAVEQRVASVQSSPVTPPAASAPERQRVASAAPDTSRATANQPISAQDSPRADTRPSTSAQQQPANVAQHVASVQPSPVTPPAASPLAQQQIASATSDASRAPANPSTSAQDRPRADARPTASAQQPPAIVAQRLEPVRPSMPIPPAVSPPEQHRIGSATPNASLAAANPPTSAHDKPRADARPSASAPQQPAIASQHLASVRPSAPTLPAASQPEQRRVASATPDASRATAPQPVSAADQQRSDAARYLKAAHVSLTANNLSAAKSRIAAALAAQPDNRDAQRLRSTVHTLEQQRDALLSLARGCSYIERWACTSRNAGIALQIDSSSKEARRLATRAERESGLQIESHADAVPQPMPEGLYAHH